MLSYGILSVEGTSSPQSSAAVFWTRSCPERGLYDPALGSCHHLKGNFHIVLSPWCPAGGEDVLKVFAAGVHLAGIQPRLSDGTVQLHWENDMDTINLKRIWEELLLVARVLSLLANLAHSPVLPSTTTGQQAVLEFTLAAGVTPVIGHFAPGTLTNQIPGGPQWASTCCDSWSPRRPPASPSPGFSSPACHSRLLCAVETLPSSATRAHSCEDLIWMLA